MVCHPSVCFPGCLLSLFVATFVISTSNSPYEQWLISWLVVLCDVAAAAEVAVEDV
jgi:hypothetical protein